MSQSLMQGAKMVGTIALRNLFSHKVKGAIVGSIMVFGTMLLIVGTAMLDSIEDSMQKVVTSSLTGQIQVADAKGRDELALFGSLTASMPELGEMKEFERVREAIEGVENVQAVVPMGMGLATGSTGNDVDQLLSSLREAVRAKDDQKIDEAAKQLQRMASLMQAEFSYREQVSSDTARLKRDQEALERVQSQAFWAREFKADPQKELLYLDTTFAPLFSEGRLFFLRYLGTDPALFAKSFDRFQIEKGQMIPPFHRGVLLSKRVHERFLKHKIAREFDRIKREIEQEGEDLATSEDLQGRVRRMSRQYKRILYQLDGGEAVQLEQKLRAYFGEQGVAIGDEDGKDLGGLVSLFLRVDADNFSNRYAWFYEHIAPMIKVYRVKVGDVVALQSFTQQGYLKGVNVKIWGTYSFKGIEDSDLAGVVNIMDMITFRELYGQMTDAQRAELSQIREKVGVEDVSKEDVEDALFGGGDSLVVESDDGDPGEGGGAVEVEPIDEFSGLDVIGLAQRKRMAETQTYEQQDVDTGLAINAAVILKDKDRIAESVEAIKAATTAAGLDLKVVDWQQAAGIVGQLIIVIRLVLYVAIFIIFAVALVIINNSMVMATMERVAEVGTMRAIGAQRRFILALFMLETLILGVVTGLLGTGLGIGVIEVLGSVGIPATNDVLRFLFAGPRLYPHVSWANVVLAVGIIFVVSVISTLYPAIVATRIQPVVAMRGGRD